MGVTPNIIRLSNETVRGTTDGSPTWLQLDEHQAGLGINESRSAWEGFLSSTFPRMTKVVPTGKRASGPLVTPLFIDQAQSLLEFGYLRTSGAAKSCTIHKKNGPAGEQRAYTGCVVERLGIRGGADDSPVIATLDFNCLGSASTTGITAATYPSGVPVMGHKTTITVNAVDITDDLDDWEITFENNSIIGPHAVNGFPKYIKDGVQRVGIQLNQSLESNALTEIMRGQSAVEVVINMATGVGTEAIVFTAPTCFVLEAPESGNAGEDKKQAATMVLQEADESGQYDFAYTTE